MLLLAELLRPLGAALGDPLFSSWHRDDCVRYLNLGMQMVATYRPDCATQTGQVELVAGARQTLPDGAVRLLDALYYCDAAGLPVSALRLVERKTLDSGAPTWMVQPRAAVVDEIVYDERFPGQFFVSPPSEGVGSVELGWSINPPPFDPMGDVDQAFPIGEQYAPAVLEWASYCAFSRDGESTNGQRAAAHRQSFFDILGIKTKVDASYAFAPRAPGQGAG